MSLILETVDATRKVLAAIETSGKEGPERFEDLTERLRVAAQLPAGPETRSADPRATLPVIAEPAVEKTPLTCTKDGQPRKKRSKER